MNHKWVSPEKYNGSDKCWIVVSGLVKKAQRLNCGKMFYFYKVSGGFPFIDEISSSYVDGVCERKDGEEKPELK